MNSTCRSSKSGGFPAAAPAADPCPGFESRWGDPICSPLLAGSSSARAPGDEDGSQVRSSGFAVRDSAGVRISENTDSAWTDDTRGQVETEPYLEIGSQHVLLALDSESGEILATAIFDEFLLGFTNRGRLVFYSEDRGHPRIRLAETILRRGP